MMRCEARTNRNNKEKDVQLTKDRTMRLLQDRSVWHSFLAPVRLPVCIFVSFQMNIFCVIPDESTDDRLS